MCRFPHTSRTEESGSGQCGGVPVAKAIGREAVCLLPLKIGVLVDVADVVPVGDCRCRKGIYGDVDAVVDCFCGGQSDHQYLAQL